MLKHSLVSVLAMCGALLAGLATYGRSQEPAALDLPVPPVRSGDSGERGPSTQDEGKSKPGDSWVVFYLRSHSVDMIASTLAQTMGPETELKVVADNRSNSLYVRGPAEALKQCEKLLEAIDQPPSQIDFEIVITVSDSTARDDADNKPRKTERIRFSTLNENMASAQLRQQVAVSSGKSDKGNGPPARSLQWQQVGTSCEIHPRLVGKTIQAQLKIETSWVVDAANDDEADAASPGIKTASLTSTLSLNPGEAHTVLANTSQGSNPNEDVSVTITATPVQVKAH